jgi:hypothetical protein
LKPGRTEEAVLFWKRDKRLSTLAVELKQLTIDYAKQETLDPLRSMGRYLAFGASGSLLLAIGLALWALAGLRALQTETGTTFTGHLSWAPYFITLAGSAIVIGVAVRAVGKERRAADRRRAERDERQDLQEGAAR